MSDQRTIHQGDELLTSKQRKSLHLWFTFIANAANDAGYDQKAVLEKFKDGFSVPTTMYFWKDIYRAGAYAMYGVQSTEEMTTKQVVELANIYMARVSEVTGILVDWPSIESLMDQSDAKD